MILKLYLPFLISEKDNYMTIIIPVFIVALIMYSVKNTQNLNTRKDRLKKIPV